MKKISILLFLLPGILLAQQKQRLDCRIFVKPAMFAFQSGLANGLNQTLVHHYSSFSMKFPKANPIFWNPNESWKNKWKNGDPTQGPAYLGSTTFLASTTDAFHMTNTISRSNLLLAGMFITLGERKPWWHYLINVGVSSLAMNIRFHLPYTFVFNGKEW